jgi:hypothetical protein
VPSLAMSHATFGPRYVAAAISDGVSLPRFGHQIADIEKTDDHSPDYVERPAAGQSPS